MEPEVVPFSFILPERLRKRLAQPFGDVLDTAACVQRLEAEQVPAIAVGDVVATSVPRHLLRAYIYDGFTQRGTESPEFVSKLADPAELVVENPPGGVRAEAWIAARAAWEDQRPLRVVGEEDLLALVLFATLPANAVVLYGQPNQGIVYGRVQEVQNRARELLEDCRNSEQNGPTEP